MSSSIILRASTLLVYSKVNVHLVSDVGKVCYWGKLFPHLVTHQAGEHFLVSASVVFFVIVHVTRHGRVSGNYILASHQIVNTSSRCHILCKDRYA